MDELEILDVDNQETIIELNTQSYDYKVDESFQNGFLPKRRLLQIKKSSQKSELSTQRMSNKYYISREERKILQQIKVMDKQQANKKKIKLENNFDNLAVQFQQKDQLQEEDKILEESPPNESQQATSQANKIPTPIQEPQPLSPHPPQPLQPPQPNRRSDINPVNPDYDFGQNSRGIFFYLWDYQEQEKDKLQYNQSSKPQKFQAHNSNQQSDSDPNDILQKTGFIQDRINQKFIENCKELKPFSIQIKEFENDNINRIMIEDILDQYKYQL